MSLGWGSATFSRPPTHTTRSFTMRWRRTSSDRPWTWRSRKKEQLGAVAALGRMGEPQLLPVLGYPMQDRSSPIRRAAVTAVSAQRPDAEQELLVAPPSMFPEVRHCICSGPAHSPRVTLPQPFLAPSNQPSALNWAPTGPILAGPERTESPPLLLHRDPSPAPSGAVFVRFRPCPPEPSVASASPFLFPSGVRHSDARVESCLSSPLGLLSWRQGHPRGLRLGRRVPIGLLLSSGDDDPLVHLHD